MLLLFFGIHLLFPETTMNLYVGEGSTAEGGKSKFHPPEADKPPTTKTRKKTSHMGLCSCKCTAK